MATEHHGTLDVVTARRGEISGEEPARAEDLRPELSAESISRGIRLALLVLTFAGAALTVLTMIAVFIRPAGVLDAGAPGAAVIGGIVILVWFLQLTFGALLENNRAVRGSAHAMWIAAFALTGPLGLLLYWFLHVWPARYEPHHEGEAAARARRRRG
jgi:hypothetical protein